MKRCFLAIAALFAFTAVSGLAQDSEDDPVVAGDREGQVRVTASQALEEIAALYGEGVLEELIVAELVRQRAAATGALIPTEGEIDLEYEQFLRNLLNMKGGYAEDREDLLSFSSAFREYFDEQAITPASVRRDIAVRMTAERILMRELKLTDEEIAAGFDSLLAELQGGEKRRVATYLFRPDLIPEADLEPGEDRVDVARSEARRFLEVLAAPDFQPNYGDIRMYAAAQPGEEPGIHQEIAFGITAPGECAGPVETPEGFLVMKLIEVFAPGQSMGAEGLTDEQRAALQTASDEYLKETAMSLLLQRKVHRELPAYLDRLRRQARIEVFWRPPTDE